MTKLKEFTFHFEDDEEVSEYYEKHDANSEALWNLTDNQLYSIIHVAAEVLAKKHDSCFDSSKPGSLEHCYYYIQRVIRYMTEVENRIPLGLKDGLDDAGVDSEELQDALQVLDKVTNY